MFLVFNNSQLSKRGVYSCSLSEVNAIAIYAIYARAGPADSVQMQ
jgi:hypothetical protein